MDNTTKKWQRMAIWIIAIVVAFGTLGFYFVIILQNSQQNQTSETDLPPQDLPLDPNAFIVEGDVTKLEVVDLVMGNGQEVKSGDRVKVHYKGTIAQTGVKFDSSYDIGEPVEFTLDGVIQGWQDGLPGAKVGGKRRLIVPSEMAYGPQGNGSVPPNADLVFEVEVLSILPPE